MRNRYTWESSTLIADARLIEGKHFSEHLQAAIAGVVAKFVNPDVLDVPDIAADMTAPAVDMFKFLDLSSYGKDQGATNE